MKNHALALDIGGGHVTASVVHLPTRQVLPSTTVRMHLDEQAPATVLLDGWARAGLLAQKRAGSPRLSHVGLAMPAPFDYQNGISLHQHKFRSLCGVEVSAALHERWESTSLEGSDLRYGNDADLFALGEWWAQQNPARQRVLGVTLGTGLGSGFIEGGRVLTADPCIPPQGEIWNLPHKGGIAEDFASGRALVLQHSHLTSRLWTVKEMAEAAQQGDPLCLQVFRNFGTELGNILQPWIERFQPDEVVLGGNISRAWPLFGAHLQTQLPAVPLRVSLLLENACLLGAAALPAVVVEQA